MDERCPSQPGTPTSPLPPDSPFFSRTQKWGPGPCSPKQTQPGDTVLIAMDGSEYSDYAFHFYLNSLHRPQNHVIVVHSTDVKSINTPVLMMDANADLSVPVLSDDAKATQTKSDALVEDISMRLKLLKVAGCVERIHGDPGPSIVAVARQQKANYVVIGCRGKSQVRRVLTGSVTDYVSHNSPVPVIIARREDSSKQGSQGKKSKDLRRKKYEKSKTWKI